MARIIKKICLMTIVLLIAISIKVYANELTLDCPDSINPETKNTLEYVLKGNFTDNVNSIKVRYTIPDGVEFKGFTPSDGWNLEQGGTADKTGLVLRISDGDVNGEIEFGKFTFSVPNTYNKESIAFKIYGLDATNTSCEIVEFSHDEVNKSILIEKQDDNSPNDNQDDENNNPSDNNNNGNNNDNGGNEEQGNNNSNTPTGDEDDEGKNGEHGENTNADSNNKDDKNKNNDGSNDINSNIGSASAGSKNDNNSWNPKYDTEKDTTVTKTPFGQYGNGKIIMTLIVIVSIMAFIGYKKLKKVKFIK